MDLLTLALAGVVILYAITPQGDSDPDEDAFVDASITQVSEHGVDHLCFVAIEPLIADVSLPSHGRVWFSDKAEYCDLTKTDRVSVNDDGVRNSWVWPQALDVKSFAAELESSFGLRLQVDNDTENGTPPDVRLSASSLRTALRVRVGVSSCTSSTPHEVQVALIGSNQPKGSYLSPRMGFGEGSSQPRAQLISVEPGSKSRPLGIIELTLRRRSVQLLRTLGEL